LAPAWEAIAVMRSSGRPRERAFVDDDELIAREGDASVVVFVEPLQHPDHG
jgi:hypothetical protein